MVQLVIFREWWLVVIFKFLANEVFYYRNNSTGIPSFDFAIFEDIIALSYYGVRILVLSLFGIKLGLVL